VRVLLIRLRTRILRVVSKPWLRGILVSCVVFAVSSVGIIVVYRHRLAWQQYSETLANNGTLPQLEIAVGAAMLGVIGIVFSLSIFSIQQVADRGTAITLREYANDWVFRTTYWTLALFVFLAMLSALQRPGLALYRISLNLGILVLSVLALKIYFSRAMKFIDPHFTVSSVAKRAKKLLTDIEKLQRIVHLEFRYQRARRRKQ
jgi:uncharacterized membrane protein